MNIRAHTQLSKEGGPTGQTDLGRRGAPPHQSLEVQTLTRPWAGGRLRRVWGPRREGADGRQGGSRGRRRLARGLGSSWLRALLASCTLLGSRHQGPGGAGRLVAPKWSLAAFLCAPRTGVPGGRPPPPDARWWRQHDLKPYLPAVAGHLRAVAPPEDQHRCVWAVSWR